MLLQLAYRFATEPSPALLWKFAGCFALKGMSAVNRFKRAAAAGGPLCPAFVFISVTDRCNLSCKGCWVTGKSPPRDMPPDMLDKIIRDFKRRGSSFFGILGGEPLLHKSILPVLGRHRDCYFQVFSNGTVFTEDTAMAMRRSGNITPLVSIEGLEKVSDERRGGSGVYGSALDALALCRKHRLITGVATSICKSNIAELATERFVCEMVSRGALYIWFYIYRPAGGTPCPELALSEDEIIRLRKFMVEIRCKAPALIVDAYWDHLGRALCPAATGISHHINPEGYAEPCPPVQFAKDRLSIGADSAEVLERSRFLDDFRRTTRAASRGCILLENPALLKEIVLRNNAESTSGRPAGIAELDAMRPLPGHNIPGREIPEKHWLYRFAKKRWFFGFGAYG